MSHGPNPLNQVLGRAAHLKDESRVSFAEYFNTLEDEMMAEQKDRDDCSSERSSLHLPVQSCEA
jgi:hypothetical protein